MVWRIGGKGGGVGFGVNFDLLSEIMLGLSRTSEAKVVFGVLHIISPEINNMANE